MENLFSLSILRRLVSIGIFGRRSVLVGSFLGITAEPHKDDNEKSKRSPQHCQCYCHNGISHIASRHFVGNTHGISQCILNPNQGATMSPVMHALSEQRSCNHDHNAELDGVISVGISQHGGYQSHDNANNK